MQRASRDVFWDGEVGREGEGVAGAAKQGTAGDGCLVRLAGRLGAEVQEAGGERVEGFCVVFEELAVFVDQHRALEGLGGSRVVADGVVGHVIEDFEGEEESGGWDVSVPGEDRLVDDLDV